VPRITETGALGAAILAATALRFRTEAEAAAGMVRPDRSYEPQQETNGSAMMSGAVCESAGHSRAIGSKTPADRAAPGIWKGGKESSRHESLRACGFPQFLAGGKGCTIWDSDGKRYVDYLMSWGTILLGHAHDEVDDEVRRRIAEGSHLNFAVEQEVSLA